MAKNLYSQSFGSFLIGQFGPNSVYPWQAIDTLRQMLEKDDKTPDVFILMQLMRYVIVKALTYYLYFNIVSDSVYCASSFY